MHSDINFNSYTIYMTLVFIFVNTISLIIRASRYFLGFSFRGSQAPGISLASEKLLNLIIKK